MDYEVQSGFSGRGGEVIHHSVITFPSPQQPPPNPSSITPVPAPPNIFESFILQESVANNSLPAPRLLPSDTTEVPSRQVLAVPPRLPEDILLDICTATLMDKPMPPLLPEPRAPSPPALSSADEAALVGKHTSSLLPDLDPDIPATSDQPPGNHADVTSTPPPGTYFHTHPRLLSLTLKTQATNTLFTFARTYRASLSFSRLHSPSTTHA